MKTTKPAPIEESLAEESPSRPLTSVAATPAASAPASRLDGVAASDKPVDSNAAGWRCLDRHRQEFRGPILNTYSNFANSV